ncbi:MAG: Arc family DNA-binding protein [Pseudomonadota bacterium]
MNLDIDEKDKQGSRAADKFVVRLPDGLRSVIAKVARNYHRSMNSEIVARLENSLKAEPLLMTDEDRTKLEAGGKTTLEVSTQEEAIIARFRQLSPNKRQALFEILNLENGINSANETI